VSGDDHPPSRPSWDCANCGKPWPCPAAREQLAAEMANTNLAMWMATTMVHAAEDVPAISPSELYERFIAWTRLPTIGAR